MFLLSYEFDFLVVSDNEIKEGRLHGDQNHDSRDKSEANDKPASELISVRQI